MNEPKISDQPVFVAPLISIVVVTRNRPIELKRCLQSLNNAARTNLPFEIILINNGGDPSGLNDLSTIKLLHCADRTPAEARNIGSKSAQGEFLFFIDDDAAVPPHYFDLFQGTLKAHPDFDILGGPDQTFKDSKLFERSVGYALLSPLATAHTRYRYGGQLEEKIITAGEAKFILCNLWFRRKLFSEEHFQFDERFFRNEENILLFQLRNKKAYYNPRLFVYHQRKTGLVSLGRAIFKSGLFRAKGSLIFPGSAGIKFFVPTAFDFYLSGLCYAPWGPAWWPLLIYFFLNLCLAFKIALSNRDGAAIPMVMFYQFFITLFYGIGFWVGMIYGVMVLTQSLRSKGSSRP